MSQRGVFCLNATTMGLSASQPSSPRDPPPELDRQPDKKDQKQQQAQEREEEKCEEQAKQQNEKPNEPLDESKKQPKEEGPKDQAQPIPAATAPQPRSAPQAPHAHPTVKDLPHICRHYAAFSLSGGCESSVGCGSVQSKSGLTLTATEHYHNQLEKLRSICGDAAVTNFELNNLFLDRLKEIDCLDEECGGDSKFATLRLATFQDWVDLLLHVNYIIFGNMTAMEVEAYEKIMNCFRSVRGEQQQAQDENRKLRKDMCAIIKLVQHAFHHNTWNTDDMCLETLTVNQLLGIQADQARPESESEKVTKDMRSLTNEMAAKHDEVRHLQSQMCALDEVVQTARQKLILKDQCIAQLNQQLVELQDCLANMSQELNNKTRTVKQYEEAFDTMDRNSCLFENINEMDQQANELMRLLNKELNEIINIISTKDFQAMEYRRKLLSCFIDRINNDRMETMRKLENMRSQLRALDCSIDQLELPLACSTQRPEDKYDNQLIDALRRRLIAINQCNKELNCRCQQVEAQQRFELLNVTSDFEAVRAINEKNCQVLKEIAELLSKLRCCDLSYEEIYTEKSSGNPFCIAIMEMYEKLNQLENNTETENLQSLNERLVCQIESLRVVLQERESKICELQTGYVDLNETNRLREEIFLLKQENCEQSQKVVQITSLLQAKEYERQEANANNEAAMQMYEDQCKELRRAHNEVKRLKECLSSLENCQQELNEERNSLRAEITALKNREAELCGKDRALNEQLKCKEQDLEKSRCLLHDMQCHLKQEERQHKETLDRLCQANDDIRKQMRDVANECKQMQLKLKYVCGSRPK
ncbi:CAP-Gly domain-containing linker protein 1 isoform X2 [Drosophila navojoa]|uniref:CAP-Gly domain-containing linker protein 1 isoform X2 n=1 Tax=Drosophila navojoa TaxID=7232 RepID=UPI0011BE3088|nr:CAP-Gly domain-containing linker protein 1 isoform X2 [Drosophila navojoa]